MLSKSLSQFPVCARYKVKYMSDYTLARENVGRMDGSRGSRIKRIGDAHFFSPFLKPQDKSVPISNLEPTGVLT